MLLCVSLVVSGFGNEDIADGSFLGLRTIGEIALIFKTE